jgi:hypothetical protein
LEGLGLIQTGLAGSSKKYLTDILKDYDKYYTQGFSEIYDPITPKYETNEKMIDALTSIEQGYVPDEVIQSMAGSGAGFTPTEEQDLKDYYGFVKNRRESEAERMYDLGGESMSSGLADPSAQFNVPISAVQNQFRDTYMGKPQTQVYEELAQKAMQDWESSPGYKAQRTTEISEPTIDFGFGTDPAAWAYNKVVDGVYNTPGIGWLARNLPGPKSTPEKDKISKNVTKKIPAFDPRKYYAEEMAKMAENERQKDVVVQQTLNRTLSRAYTSPYELQVREAIKRLGL